MQFSVHFTSLLLFYETSITFRCIIFLLDKPPQFTFILFFSLNYTEITARVPLNQTLIRLLSRTVVAFQKLLNLTTNFPITETETNWIKQKPVIDNKNYGVIRLCLQNVKHYSTHQLILPAVSVSYQAEDTVVTASPTLHFSFMSVHSLSASQKDHHKLSGFTCLLLTLVIGYMFACVYSLDQVSLLFCFFFLYQTVELRSQAQQCPVNASTQMTGIGCYVSCMSDKLVTTGKYTTADEHHDRRLRAVGVHWACVVMMHYGFKISRTKCLCTPAQTKGFIFYALSCSVEQDWRYQNK